MKRTTLIDLIEAFKRLELEVSTLRAELAPRRRLARQPKASLNSSEVAALLGIDRKTFYRQGLPALLTRAPLGRGWTRRSVEALVARQKGTAL